MFRTSSEDANFTATKGWYDKFRIRFAKNFQNPQMFADIKNRLNSKISESQISEQNIDNKCNFKKFVFDESA